MSNDIIPIDNVVTEFKDYLLAHPRTIFSAGFGEGKSYFLSEFQNRTEDSFQFISLYPVNYQVAENQDIFKLIKRDVFFQLFSKDIIDSSFPVKQSVALSFFLSNPQNYLPLIGEWMMELDYPSETVNHIIKPVVEFFKKMNDCYKDFYKEKALHPGENELDELLEYLDNKGVYECDAITKWIQESISIWKKQNPGKKIVLLVEDLDRIDPAHIFRILNVLSAHIDYGYRVQVPIAKDSIIGNKFGFDNVVCVVDHRNLKHIYHHFYGPRTSWDGYIEKFTSNGFFEYSLSDLKHSHFISLIATECGLSKEVVTLLFSKEMLKDLSLRSLSNCLINTSAQIGEIKPYEGNRVFTVFPKEFLTLSVILHRLGISKGEILRQITEVVKGDYNAKKYILPFFYTKHTEEQKVIFLGESVSGYDVAYSLSVSSDKEYSISSTKFGNRLERNETWETLISYMLSYIKVG